MYVDEAAAVAEFKILMTTKSLLGRGRAATTATSSAHGTATSPRARPRWRRSLRAGAARAGRGRRPRVLGRTAPHPAPFGDAGRPGLRGIPVATGIPVSLLNRGDQ